MQVNDLYLSFTQMKIPSPYTYCFSINCEFKVKLILERIVMTPKKKTANSTSLAMERKRLHPQGEGPRKTSLHVAGGEHQVVQVFNPRVARLS